MKRAAWKRAAVLGGVALLGSVATLVAVRARAAGIPDANALTYTGYLESPDGQPLAGMHSISVRFWADETVKDSLCSGELGDTELVSGRFQVPLPDSCTDVVRANASLFVDVQVDGASLGRTKLGAVPYAVEAGHALVADQSALADKATTATSATSATNATNAKTADSAKSADTAKAVTAGLLTHGHTLGATFTTSAGASVNNGDPGQVCSAACAAGTALTGGGCLSTGCGAGFNYPCAGMNLEASGPDGTGTAWCCYFQNSSGSTHAIHAQNICSSVGSKTLP